MTAFTHITVGTNDLEKSRAFYDKVLGALGWTRLADLGDNGSAWGAGQPAFLALKPLNGQPATFGNGVTVSFAAPNRSAVTAFHQAAVALGGTDEGAVGPRDWNPMAFGAYVRDPDGNKLAVYSFTAD
jgi:catechol 2,3-dioxygenase-like lactoylglutathione lyase family enzyme